MQATATITRHRDIADITDALQSTHIHEMRLSGEWIREEENCSNQAFNNQGPHFLVTSGWSRMHNPCNVEPNILLHPLSCVLGAQQRLLTQVVSEFTDHGDKVILATVMGNQCYIGGIVKAVAEPIAHQTRQALNNVLPD
jgi:hypothetical protein